MAGGAEPAQRRPCESPFGGRLLTGVEIPFENASLPGYFIPGDPPDGSPAPVAIQWNGLNSTKEMMVYSRFPEMLAQRGISTLAIDTPGSGE